MTQKRPITYFLCFLTFYDVRFSSISISLSLSLALFGIICCEQVAELMPDDICRKILNAVKNNLQHYVGRMSSEDLKRDSKSALFGAIDHVRCARML